MNPIKILVQRRAYYLKHGGGKIAIPGGHIEKNESSLVGTFRELQEETGLITNEYSDIQLLFFNKTIACYLLFYNNEPIEGPMDKFVGELDIKWTKHPYHKWINIDELVVDPAVWNLTQKVLIKLKKLLINVE